MIVCHCSVVSDRSVSAAVENGARTLGQVCQSTGAGKDCGACVFSVKRVMTETLTCHHRRLDAGLAEVQVIAG